MILSIMLTAALAYEPIVVTEGGSVHGVVHSDAAAIHEALPVTQDPEACGQSVASEVLQVSGGKLANAVVFVDGITAGAEATPVQASLDQTGCHYVPHVQALPKNSTLTIINSDPVLHNTHAYLGGTRTIFNLAMPEQGQRIPKVLRRSGLMPIKCDAGHTWMSAYVYVFDHPYFAVTGADGAYEIKDLPSGSYTLTVWHEKLGSQSQELTVVPGAAAGVDFKL